MFLTKEYSLYWPEDYKTTVVGATFVASEPLSDNQFTVSDEGVAHVKSASGLPGYFALVLPDIEIGDMIECECEMRVISGTSFINIDEYPGIVYVSKTPKKVGEWETFSLKAIAKKEQSHAITLGVSTNNASEVYIKNLRVRTYTKKQKRVSSYRKYHIAKVGGTFVMKGGSASDLATLTEPNEQTLRITHNLKLVGRTPISVVGGDFNANLYSIIARTGNEDSYKLDVRFMKLSDGSLYNLADIPNGLQFKVAVFTD